MGLRLQNRMEQRRLLKYEVRGAGVEVGVHRGNWGQVKGSDFVSGSLLTSCVALPRHFTFLGLNFLICMKIGPEKL